MMHVLISSPQEMIYSGSAAEIKLRTTEGEIQLLTGHMPYMAEVGKGVLKVKAGEKVICIETSGGVVYNCKNKVSIVLFMPYAWTGKV